MSSAAVRVVVALAAVSDGSSEEMVATALAAYDATANAQQSEAGFVLPPPQSSDFFTSSSLPPPTQLGYHTGFVLPPPTSPEPNQSDDFLRSSTSPPLTLASMPELVLTPVVSRARKVARLVSWLAYF